MKKILLIAAMSMLMIGCSQATPENYPMTCFRSEKATNQCFCCNTYNTEGKECRYDNVAAFGFAKCEVAEDFGFKIVTRHPKVQGWHRE